MNRSEESSKDIFIWGDGARIETRRPQGGDLCSKQSGRSYEIVLDSVYVTARVLQWRTRMAKQ